MLNGTSNYYWKVIGIAGALAGLVAWPGTGQAQLDPGGILPPPPISLPPISPPSISPAPTTVSSPASAVTAVVSGTVTSLGDAGTLVDAADPVGTGQPLASIPGLLSAEALQAAAMMWTDQVASDASLGNLFMTVGGTTVWADFIESRALAVSGAVPTGLSSIEVLTAGSAYAHFVPAPCDFSTGGGFVFTDSGARANFGAHGGCKHGAFWGHVNFLDHGFNPPGHLRSTEITGYLMDPAFPNARDI